MLPMLRLTAQSPHRPYPYLSFLIVGFAGVTLLLGIILLRYIEARMVAGTGETLALAATEITDKLDRLLFERYGDALLMAQAYAAPDRHAQDLSTHLRAVKQAYSPVYLWLGVTDAHGRIIAATEPDLIGHDFQNTAWFRQTEQQRVIQVGDVGDDEVIRGMKSMSFTAPIVNAHGEWIGVVTSRVGIPMLEDVVTGTIQTIQRQEGFLGTMEYQFVTHAGDLFIDSEASGSEAFNLKTMRLPSALLHDTDESGFVEERHARRHVPILTGYARTKGYGDFRGLQWTVLIRLDRDDIVAPIRRVLITVGLGGFVIWAPMLALLLWSTGRLRTEWSQTQQEARRAHEAEARTRMMIETALDGVVGIDEDGHITDWNAQAALMFGWTREEMLRRPITRIIPPTQLKEPGILQQFLSARHDAGRKLRFEALAQHHNGQTFPVDIAVAAHQSGLATEVSAFIRDITESKRAEQRLRVQHATTKILAEATTFESATSLLLAAICEPLGWDVGLVWRQDADSAVVRCLEQWTTPNPAVIEFATQSRQYTFARGVGLPGRVWDTQASVWLVDLLHDQNFLRRDVAAHAGLRSAMAFPIVLHGDVKGVMEFFTTEGRQPDEPMLALMATIGGQIGRLMERTELEDQLRQSQKMEAVGQLAGGIAHDFNNLLTVILGYSEVLLGDRTVVGQRHDNMVSIQEAARRAANLTNQLLAFSRRQIVEPTRLQVNTVIETFRPLLPRVLGEDVEVCLILTPNLQDVRMGPGQLEQVLMNLAVNARDAMPMGGRLVIQTNAVMLAQHRTLSPGPYITVQVSDTGCGMNAHTQAHIFEPFFTTKPVGKGTGLGLSTVYGIASQAGGSIDVESELNKGTTLTLYLPQLESLTDTAQPASSQHRSRAHTETILCVEDEPSIRGLLQETLRGAGYRVVVAADGLEAVRLSRSVSGSIHLLVTDVVMPQMSGRELADELTAAQSDLKVLYISGYTDDAMVRHGVSQASRSFLQKPFSPSSLLKKVEEVLEGQESRTSRVLEVSDNPT